MQQMGQIIKRIAQRNYWGQKNDAAGIWTQHHTQPYTREMTRTEKWNQNKQVVTQIWTEMYIYTPVIYKNKVSLRQANFIWNPGLQGLEQPAQHVEFVRCL